MMRMDQTRRRMRMSKEIYLVFLGMLAGILAWMVFDYLE